MTESGTRSVKILKGAEAIANYIGVSKNTLQGMLRLIPHIYIGGMIFSHVDAIETTFERICQNKNLKGKDLSPGSDSGG